MDDQGIAVFAEVDPAARTEIDLTPKNTGTGSSDTGEVPLLHSDQRVYSLGRGLSVESIEPPRIRTAAVWVDTLPVYQSKPNSTMPDAVSMSVAHRIGCAHQGTGRRRAAKGEGGVAVRA